MSSVLCTSAEIGEVKNLYLSVELECLIVLCLFNQAKKYQKDPIVPATDHGFSVKQPPVSACPLPTVLNINPHIVPNTQVIPGSQVVPNSQVIPNARSFSTSVLPQEAPKIVLTPIPVVLHVEAVDDRVQGTGIDQFNYVGSGWGHCSNCSSTPPNPPNAYNHSNSWDNTINDYVTITFHGTQIKFYGVVGSPHGIGAFSIDGGSETMLDFYAPTEAGNTLLYTSPVLQSGQHVLKVRVTGSQNSNASWNGINPDRVDILN